MANWTVTIVYKIRNRHCWQIWWQFLIFWWKNYPREMPVSFKWSERCLFGDNLSEWDFHLSFKGLLQFLLESHQGLNYIKSLPLCLAICCVVRVTYERTCIKETSNSTTFSSQNMVIAIFEGVSLVLEECQAGFKLQGT